MKPKAIISKEQEEITIKQGRMLAMQFKAATNKKWFKLLHITRVTRGETEETIKAKLQALIWLNLAVSKQFNGETKYCIVLEPKDRLGYYKECLEALNQDREACMREIEKLEANYDNH